MNRKMIELERAYDLIEKAKTEKLTKEERLILMAYYARHGRSSYVATKPVKSIQEGIMLKAKAKRERKR